MFTAEELKRYSRQMLLPDLGRQGQEKLKQARVLVIGAGGLGSPVLLYLAAAGAGNIGIVDFDVVDESNLQRQVLYTNADIGFSKALRAKFRLQELNPHINVDAYELNLDSGNAMEIIGRYDIVVDGSDNLPTRYLVNDACLLLKRTLIYGAIFQFEGQVSVFNELMRDGSRGPNYRDLFPEPPPPEMVPSCNVGGVLGVLPGIIGSMQASEAIKAIAGIGTTLSGRLLIFDALDFTSRILNLKTQPDNPVSGSNPTIHSLIDYEAFCNGTSKSNVKELLPLDIKSLRDKNSIQLIDVRETFEFDADNIGGLNIPLRFITERSNLIDKDRVVVVHCKSGQRSLQAIHELEMLGFTNLVNMKGGMDRWRREVER